MIRLVIREHSLILAPYRALSVDLYITFTRSFIIKSWDTILIATCSSVLQVALTDEEHSNRKSSDNKREEEVGDCVKELAHSQKHTSKRMSWKYTVFRQSAEYVASRLRGCICNEMYETRSSMQGCTYTKHCCWKMLLKNVSLDWSVTLDKICIERISTT